MSNVIRLERDSLRGLPLSFSISRWFNVHPVEAALSMGVGLFLWSSLAAAKPVQVAVQVEETKANGKTWDGFKGAPDIAICLSDGVRTWCLPDGASPKAILRARCQDSFSCLFNIELEPEKMYSVTVVDVDATDNDTVGSALCAVGGTCKAGQAMVLLN